MPNRKPLNLQKLCLDVLAANFDRIQHKLADQPAIFVAELYNRLCQQNKETERRLPTDIFVHSRTKSVHHLNLLDLPITTLLVEIGQVCKNLMDLDLGRSLFGKGIPPRSLIKLLPNLPQIQRLRVHGSMCTDEVVHAFARKYPQLRILILDYCIKLTDAGLRLLHRCKKLEHLDVRRTKVTHNGCLAILNQLPLLKTFENDCWEDLFDLLNQQWKFNKRLRTYSLEGKVAIYPIHQQDVIFMVKSFPNLRSLFVPSAETFGSVFALRGHVMQKLTSLRLAGVQSVDVSVICHVCPMLENLVLNKCSIFSETGGAVGLDESIGQRLERFHICDCPTVTDDLICQLFKLKALRNVKIFKVCLCHLITLHSILELLAKRCPLKTLIFLCCDNIDDSAYREIVTYVRSNNLDLEIEHLAALQILLFS